MQLFTFLCMEGKKVGVKSAQKMANCGENGHSTPVFQKMWIKFYPLFKKQAKNTKKSQKMRKKADFLWITTPKFAHHTKIKNRKKRWITPKKGVKTGEKQAK